MAAIHAYLYVVAHLGTVQLQPFPATAASHPRFLSMEVATTKELPVCIQIDGKPVPVLQTTTT